MEKTQINSLSGKNILLGVSSSVAAYRALDLASMIRKAGGQVRVVTTENTLNLVGAAAFDAMTHKRTVWTLWGGVHSGEMDHLEFTKWADLFVICPATANVLAKTAHGIADDALGTFVLAWNKNPLMFAPAMNPEMWKNPVTQENVALLKRRGHQFIGPVSGPTACDDVGTGRLAPMEDVFKFIVDQLLEEKPLLGKRLVITAGPTREFADDVRCITNPSTGKQGIALAEVAVEMGAEVTLILGPTPLCPSRQVGEVKRVESAEEMLAAVLEALPRADGAVFAAAVSDWRPKERVSGKQKKTDVPTAMTLELVRTPDIAAVANEQRHPGQVFLGFAAESENLEGYAQAKMERKGFDLVFANPINEQGSGFASDSNKGILFGKGGFRRELVLLDKRQVAGELLLELARLFFKESAQT